MAKLEFPKGFLWGTASSAHQYEGGNKWNDWWEFEHQGHCEGKQCSGNACDSYRRFKEDFDLAKDLNLNAQRISIEWSRIYKERGKVDRKEIEHYREVLKYLKKLNMTTFVTLHHFTNPLWFSELGGWEKEENIKYFLEFVEIVAKEFGDLVDYWSTFNEPIAPYLTVSYLVKLWPPRKRSPYLFFKAARNLVKAHNESYKTIKKHLPKAQIGVVYNISTHMPIFSPEKLFTPLLNYIRNWWFLDKVYKSCDYIGINYYFPLRFIKKKGFRTEMGWEVDPSGFHEALIKVSKRYNKTIYVTENGIANAGDEHRTAYIIEHIKAMHKAIKDGADVRGYFHWSLLDNFEWNSGYWRKFGVFDVNFETFERIERPSAKVYSLIAKENSLDSLDLTKSERKPEMALSDSSFK